MKQDTKVCVIGIWHLGSVTSACLADLGYHVIGYDKDQKKVEELNKGNPPLFEPGLNELITKNIKLNKLRGSLVSYVGDAREVVIKNNLVGIADRVIMNHPVAADKFIDVACKALKKEGGILHFYDFLKTEELEEPMEKKVIDKIMKYSRQVEKIFTKKIVRPIAPHTYQVVIDLKIK